MTQNSSVKTVSAPGRGDAFTVSSESGAQLALQFNPNEATVAREGNDLIFDLDDGGRVTLGDFFAVGEGPLPTLVMPDGAQVAAADFLAALDIDASPAAGPTGNTADGSGSGEYSDDPGSLMDGISRLGAQGTFYWGREPEPEQEQRGLIYPGGSYSFNIDSETTFGVVAAVYEDGRPYQHTGDYDTVVAGKISLAISPDPGSDVGGIRFIGLDTGTLYFGDPNDPDSTIIVPDENGVYHLTEAMLAAGVYFLPDQNNSDADISFTIEMDFTSGNMTNTVSGNAVIVVDAVADYTVIEDAYLVADESGHLLGSREEIGEHRNEEGVFYSEYDTRLEGDSGQGRATVTVTVTGSFDDYEDGSEMHYFLVSTTVATESGNTLGVELLESSLPEGYSYVGTVEIGGVVYYKIAVSTELIAAEGGTATLDVDFTVSGVAGDETITWTVGTQAVEENFSGEEPDLSNNISTSLDKVTTTVDVVNSKLSVTVGWASEGNNDAKHLGANSTSGDYTAADSLSQKDATLTDEATGAVNLGAPITFSLSGAENSGEYISSLSLGLDNFSVQGESRGSIGYIDAGGNYVPLVDGSGAILADSFTDGNGNTYSVSYDPDGNSLLVTLDSGPGSGTLELVFQPTTDSSSAQYYNSAEIDFDFSLDVSNGEGASAEYTGSSTIALDAVADMATDVGFGDPLYGRTYEAGGETLSAAAAAPGETVAVSGSAAFADNDGSERHYIVLSLSTASQDEGWAFSGAGSYLTAADIAAYWENATGVPEAYLSSALSDVGAAYILLEAYLSDAGQWILEVNDGSAAYTYNLSTGVGELPDYLESVSYDPATGTLSYTASVTAPAGATEDGQADISMQAVSIESAVDGDIEYDYANNVAVTEAESVTLHVSPADSGAAAETVDTYEDGSANKHWGAAETNMNTGKGTSSHSYKEEGSSASTYKKVTATSGDDGTITFSLANPAGSNVEYITEIRFSIDGKLEDQGTLTYNGQTLQAGDPDTSTGSYYYYDQGSGSTIVVLAVDVAISNGSLAGETEISLVYEPLGDHNDIDLKVTGYEVDTINAASFDTNTIKNEQGFTLVVDAVAAKPTELSSDDPVYAGEQESAQPGDSVSVNFSLTFNDMSDSNEVRSLLLQTPVNGDSYSTLALTYTEGGQQKTVTIDIAAVLADPDSFPNISISKVTIDGMTYYKISGSTLDGYLESVTDASGETATVEATLTVEMSGYYTGGGQSGDHTVTYRYGAMTEDVDTDGDGGSTTVNDAAFASDSFSIEVSAVGSSLGVSVGGAYENADATAHVGYKERMALLAREDFASDKEYEAHLEEYAAHLESLKASSASITVTLGGEDPGEYISNAVFSVTYGNSNEIPGQFMYQGALIDLPEPSDSQTVTSVTTDDGNGNAITCTVDWSSGTVTVSIENYQATDANGGDSLYFVPGHNYSSEDVSLDYVITVTDPSSGFDKIFTNNADLIDGSDLVEGVDYAVDKSGQADSIVVDAVAQQAELSDVSVSGAGDDGQTHGSIKPGAAATVKLSVDVRGDVTDGSESHTLLLQYAAGCAYKSITITYTDIDGSQQTVTISGDTLADLFGWQRLGDSLTGSSSGGTDYYTLDLAAAITAAGGTALGEGAMSIGIEVGTSPGASDDVTLTIGVLTQEDYAAVTAGGDQEPDTGNNTAWAFADATLQFSGSGSVGISVNGNFYENNTADAHITSDPPYSGAGVLLGLALGDGDDLLTTFEIALDDDGSGTLYYFADADDYADWAAAVAKGEVDPYDATALAQYNGKDLGASYSYSQNDGVGLSGDGALVFMPANDSYSGADPTFTYSITVTDPDSGAQTSVSNATGKITADSVAQIPDIDGENGISGGGQADITAGQSREVGITASFEDLDGSTSHYILVEAVAGWTVSYTYIYTNENGDPVTVTKTLSAEQIVSYEEGGAVYYRIDVTDYAMAAGGEVTVNVTITAPSNSLYYGEYNFDVGAVSVETAEGKELTYHNNTATVFVDGAVSGKLTGSGSGGGTVLQQTSSLYEDNRPYKNLSDKQAMEQYNEGSDYEIGGDFVINYPGAAYATITVPTDEQGNPLLELSGDSVVGYDAATNTYTIKLEADGTAGFTASVTEHYAYNDEDLAFESLVLYDGDPAGSGRELDRYTDLEVIIDAVADRTDLEVSTTENAGSQIAGDPNMSEEDRQAAIAGDAVVATAEAGGDNTAVFTVTAEFKDTDSSESHYILVEMTPSWEYAGDYEYSVIYIDGSAYYSIDVTADANSGKTEFGIKMLYTGGGDADDLFGETDAGLTSYELTVGAMSVEKGTDLETDLSNNIAINLEKSVTLYYSPVDSEPELNLPSVIDEETASVTITLSGIATDKNDVLLGLTITYKQTDDSTEPGGVLYLYDGSNKTVIASGSTITDAETLAKLASGEYTLLFEPTAYSHSDVEFTWSATVQDSVSGAVKEFDDESVILVINAVADGSDNSISAGDVSGDYSAVLSGENAVITIVTDFGDTVNDSEEHWVVLQQDATYTIVSVTITGDGGTSTHTLAELLAAGLLVTKYDESGNAYYALLMEGQGNYKVAFTVSTPEVAADTSYGLKAGTIVIETSTDSDTNREPDLSDNWIANIDTVYIETGVLETDPAQVSLSVPDATEDEYAAVFINLPAGFDGYNETVILTITNCADGAFYTYDSQTGEYTQVFDLVAGETHYFKANENHSGQVNVEYTVTATDNASGATDSADKKLSVEVAPVSDLAEDLASEVLGRDGTAITVSLAATFPDDSGTESHYLFIAAVAGIVVYGWELVTLAADNAYGLEEGVYYRYSAGGDQSEVSAQVSLILDQDYDGTTSLAWYAVSKDGDAAPAVVASNSDQLNDASIALDLADLGIYRLDGSQGVYYASDNSELIYASDSGGAVYGGAGDDVIFAGSGGGIIHGGQGNDILYGGAGTDTFVWLLGDLDGSTDRIFDFSLAEQDSLDFRDLLGNGEPLDDLLNYLSIEDISGDTVSISVDNQDGATVNLEVTFKNGELQDFIDNCGSSATQEEINNALLVQMLYGVTG